VPLKETIKGFKMIINGECDNLPEQAFYMVGPIEEAIEKAKLLQEPGSQGQPAEKAKQPTAGKPEGQAAEKPKPQ